MKKSKMLKSRPGHYAVLFLGFRLEKLVCDIYFNTQSSTENRLSGNSCYSLIWLSIVWDGSLFFVCHESTPFISYFIYIITVLLVCLDNKFTCTVMLQSLDRPVVYSAIRSK